MSSTAFNLEAVIKPALDAYGAEIARHDQDFSQYPVRRCACGFTPRNQGSHAGNAVGLHIAAAEKRADKVFTAEAARLRTEALAR